MNESKIVKPDFEWCCRRALDLFVKESGVSKEGAKYEKMRKNAFRIREEIASKVDVKGVYSYYEDFILEGKILKLEGKEFRCNAFELLQSDTLEGVCFYAVTAGDYYLAERPIMDQLYADIWGTAFTDAMREAVMQELKTETAISDSFGPGFYGMNVMEMHKMPAMVDFAGLGMEVRESGIILPLKSCAGIVFRVNEKYEKLNAACRHCLGNRKTCTLCAMRESMQEQERAQG